MKAAAGTILCVVLAVGSVAAQTVQDGQEALRHAVLKQQLYLRGLSADEQVRLRWDGGSLVQEPPRAHMFGPVIAKSIKFKKDQVEIRGVRYQIAVQKDGTPAFSETKDPVVIRVDLKGANVTEVLPRLGDLLFYPDLASALADVPERFRKGVQLDEHPHAPDAQPPASRLKCDCSDLGTAACKSSTAEVGMAGMTAPKVLRMVDPEFSEDARRQKFSAAVEIVSMSTRRDIRRTSGWCAEPL